jgi:hypothetical protein
MDLSVFPAQLPLMSRNSSAIHINWKNLPMCTLTADAEINFRAWLAAAMSNARQLASTCRLHELGAARKSGAHFRKFRVPPQVRALRIREISLTHYYWWGKT